MSSHQTEVLWPGEPYRYLGRWHQPILRTDRALGPRAAFTYTVARALTRAGLARRVATTMQEVRVDLLSFAETRNRHLPETARRSLVVEIHHRPPWPREAPGRGGDGSG